ncbi:molybdopterin-dependent oxidoreductase [Rhodococcoides yunnanense]|uniref:molybdopterin-dependent oxidoreductase n=1 Tax=Rhodococcoides yunnanense TaxID=278209 RepID=UPI000AFDC022|nr:molybdopterin-dependent oxidoreductase [Rhodococcus yunnanensis]
MAHWGMFRASASGGEITEVHPEAGDASPSQVLGNVPGSVRHRSRITGPAVRRGWLENGPGPSEKRGSDDYVAVSWDELTDLLAAELRRVVDRYGNESIYGGSYGWASAGRFHHAQSQVHRFLNCIGGYTRSVNSYSTGATSVVMPHVLGAHWQMFSRSTSWDVIADNTDLLVAFGGVPVKNTSVNHGGTSNHPTEGALNALRARGGKIVTVSPLRDDMTGSATWLAPIPGSDVAVMLGLAHVLVTEGRHDTGFLDTYCTGYEKFERYLLGAVDGVAKSAAWAAQRSGLREDEIVALARDMSSRRTLVTVTWSLQRIKNGEQAPWMGLTLAAMLGQIGIPGGGFGHGYGSMNEPGLAPVPYPLPTLPQGHNPVATFIPVAAISEMLLNPGALFEYNGDTSVYPDIKLVHWAGGNPFHHHQDLGRLRRALTRPDTIVVHDPYWTPMAKHADIVVPSTTSLERSDISCTRNDPLLVAMQPAVPRFADSRDDYDTFAAVAEKMGCAQEFTEGRTSGEWIRHLYRQWQGYLRNSGVDTPSFDDFWRDGSVAMNTEDRLTLFEDYRRDPVKNALRTPSGRIEIFSEVIDGFGYEDCAGHPAWFEPTEWLGGERAEMFPLHLIANQPRTRLHSQLDHGATSQASKVQGREPIRMHSSAASARGIADGDVVRVFNDRGACLAGVVVDDGMLARVVQLSTGAWYDPVDAADTASMCKHGNPNVLTPDVGASSLSQGCTGQHVLVQIERYDEELPPITAFDPPQVIDRVRTPLV